MGMTKGTPASSQIVFLEQRVAVLEDDNERMRAALRDIRDMGPMTVDDQRWRIAKNALEVKND